MKEETESTLRAMASFPLLFAAEVPMAGDQSVGSFRMSMQIPPLELTLGWKIRLGLPTQLCQLETQTSQQKTQDQTETCHTPHARHLFPKAKTELPLMMMCQSRR